MSRCINLVGDAFNLFRSPCTRTCRRENVICDVCLDSDRPENAYGVGLSHYRDIIEIVGTDLKMKRTENGVKFLGFVEENKLFQLKFKFNLDPYFYKCELCNQEMKRSNPYCEKCDSDHVNEDLCKKINSYENYNQNGFRCLRLKSTNMLFINVENNNVDIRSEEEKSKSSIKNIFLNFGKTKLYLGSVAYQNVINYSPEMFTFGRCIAKMNEGVCGNIRSNDFYCSDHETNGQPMYLSNSQNLGRLIFGISHAHSITKSNPDIACQLFHLCTVKKCGKEILKGLRFICSDHLFKHPSVDDVCFKATPYQIENGKCVNYDSLSKGCQEDLFCLCPDAIKNDESDGCECVCCTFKCDDESLNPCQHKVHEICVALSGSKKCPLCRVEITFSSKRNENLSKYIKSERALGMNFEGLSISDDEKDSDDESLPELSNSDDEKSSDNHVQRETRNLPTHLEVHNNTMPSRGNFINRAPNYTSTRYRLNSAPDVTEQSFPFSDSNLTLTDIVNQFNGCNN